MARTGKGETGGRPFSVSFALGETVEREREIRRFGARPPNRAGVGPGALAADAWIAVPTERPLPLLHRADTVATVFPRLSTHPSMVPEVGVEWSLSA